MKKIIISLFITILLIFINNGGGFTEHDVNAVFKTTDEASRLNQTTERPKNVILMIGDGMGLGQIEIARLFEYGKEGRLFLETLPNVALVHTYSANNYVTDSAAAGTALVNKQPDGCLPFGR